jgi:hypothetical protein
MYCGEQYAIINSLIWSFAAISKGVFLSRESFNVVRAPLWIRIGIILGLLDSAA